MFQEDQGMLYRKTQGTRQLKRKVPKMAIFEKLWGGILEDNTKTPQRKWMNTVAKKIGEKVVNVQELMITKEKHYDTVKKQKNLPVPGVQNFYWKKFRSTWSSLLKCFNKWIEQPDEIPDWLTLGRTVLIPKSDDLINERNYCPITCLDTCYKIFTGMIGNFMKNHAKRNNSWDKSQLGTCSGVLGTVIS